MTVKRVSAYRSERDGSIHEHRQLAEAHDRRLHAREIIGGWLEARLPSSGIDRETILEELVKDLSLFRIVADVLAGREP